MYDFAHHLRDAIDKARAHGVSNLSIEDDLIAVMREVRAACVADASTGENDTALGTE